MNVALDKEFLQSLNVSSLKNLVDWEQVGKISQNNNLQPESALALASFIGKSYCKVVMAIISINLSYSCSIQIQSLKSSCK